LISIKHFPRLKGRGSSDSTRAPGSKIIKEDDFGPASLFGREPTDFDLITQLTHMSAVATSGIARDKLFEGTAELDYSTSKYFRRVHRVAQRLNYDYSQACEIVGDQARDESVQNLLLHFSTALSAGESEADFLRRETEVQLELYGKKYERDMESLRKWTDAYIALMVSTTLIIVISLVSMMIYPVGTIAIAGLALVVMMVTAAGGWIIFTVAPHEVKTHRLARRSAEQAQMEKLAVVLVSITGPVFVLGWIMFNLGVAMIVSSLLLTPIAWLAWQDDKKVDQRDRDLPGFLRGLGSVMGAVGTTVAEGLSRLNRRSLGAMEPHVRKLYVRLTNDLPPEMTWARLAGETGSELVTRCIRIFSDGIKVGGDAAAVGELASSFGQKVALMRASRSMVSNSFSFVVVPMHAALLGIILFVTEVVLIFGGKIAEVQQQNLDSDLISEAGVSNSIVFASPDAAFIRLLVVISIIMLTAANSFAPYAAGGGHRYRIFNYAVIMMLISGISYLVIPQIVESLFASVSQTPAISGVPVS
jgi:archaeal flagellar protein FlaJ